MSAVEFKRLKVLWRLAEALNRQKALQPVLDEALAVLTEQTDLPSGWVALRTSGDGVLRLAATCGETPAFAQADERAPSASCHCARALAGGSLKQAICAACCAGALKDGRRGPRISVPLQDESGPVGLLNLAPAGERAPSADELATLTRAGRLIAAAVRRTAAQDEDPRDEAMRLLLAMASDGMVVADRDLRVVRFANAAAQDTLGVCGEGQGLLIAGDVRERMAEDVMPHVRQNGRWRGELAVTADDVTRWLSLLVAAEDRGDAVLMLARDITRRKEFEQAAHNRLLLERALRLIDDALVRAEADGVLRAVCEGAQAFGNACWTGVPDGDELQPVEVQPLELTRDVRHTRDEAPAGDGDVARMAARERRTVIEDLPKGSGKEPRGVFERRGWRHAVAVPLQMAGEVFGVVAVYAERPFVRDAVQCIEEMARHAAAALFDLRSRQELATAALEHERWRRLAVDAEKRFRDLADTAMTGILMTEPSGAIVYANAAVRTLSGYNTLLGMQFDDLLTVWPKERRLHEARVRHSDGRLIPVEVSRSAIGEPPDNLFAFFLHDLTRRKTLENQLQYLADHDALTGAMNRRRFQQCLGACVRRGGHGAVLFIDLDGFKEINDAYGHQRGDELLKLVALAILRPLKDQPDVLGRIGGDEFAVLLRGADRDDAVQTASRILDGVSGIRVEGGRVPGEIACSIGIAPFRRSERSAAELLALADRAMYMAKGSGKHRYAVIGE